MSEETRTIALIKPIIFSTYGRGDMAAALVRHLGGKIDSWRGGNAHEQTREDMILRTCWDWFSGGTTAESVAREIETALNA